MTRSLSPWTDELTQKLRELWPTYSANQIVVIFGRDHGFYLTRNAVIGKAHRLSIDLKTRPMAPPKLDKPKIRRRMGTLKISVVAPQAAPVPFVPRVVAAAPPRNLTLLELTDDACKWECSGQDDASEFRFCGHDSIEGKPYCAAHCKTSYLAPTKPNKMKAAA